MNARPKTNRTQEHKIVLRLAPDKWDELAAQAKDNYRTINAEIAIRLLESLPQNP